MHMLREVGDANPLVSLLEEKRDFTPRVDALLSWDFPDMPSREDLTQIHARLAEREYTCCDLDELLIDYKTRPAMAKTLLMVYFAGTGILFKRIPKPNYDSTDVLLLEFENFLEAYRNYRKREDEFLACTSIELDEIKRDLDERVISIAKRWTTRLGLENANWLSMPNPTIVTLLEPFGKKRVQETLLLGLNYWKNREYEMALDFLGCAAMQGLVGAMSEFGRRCKSVQLPPNLQQKQEIADRWIVKAAARGDADAHGFLAKKCKDAGDKEGEINWYLCAAEQGHRVAQSNVGELLCARNEKNVGRAWIRKSAEQNDAYGQLSLGEMMFEGVEVPKDQAGGLRLIRASAEQGCAPAQAYLGKLYVKAGNIESAVAWLTKAAEQKNPLGALELGKIVEARGELENAKKYYQIALEKCPEAGCRLGLIQLRSGEEELGLKNLEEAGSKGYLQAYVEFADYIFTKNTSDDDAISKACKYLHLAVQKGNVAACNLSGKIAFEGRTKIVRNLQRAREYFTYAADCGDGNGEFNLGCMVLYGFDGPMDERKALNWFKKALAHKYEPAQAEIDKLLQKFPQLKHDVDGDFDAVVLKL